MAEDAPNVINQQTEVPLEADKPITVLLVDDQRFIGLVLKQLLAPMRDIVLHQCVEASLAVARANELKPDVILQDLVMDIDGLTLVREYRQNPLTAATPIVVLSGSDDAASRAGAASAGANDYLVKVPKADVLAACLRRHARATRVDGVVHELVRVQEQSS